MIILVINCILLINIVEPGIKYCDDKTIKCNYYETTGTIMACIIATLILINDILIYYIK